MAQVSPEDLQQAINALVVRIVGRLQMFKESQDGVRHVVDTLQEGHQVLKKEFFEHVSTVEEKFKGDVGEARRQLVVIKGGTLRK